VAARGHSSRSAFQVRPGLARGCQLKGITALDFDRYLEAFRARFNPILAAFLESLRGRPSRVGGAAPAVFSEIERFTLQGGKRTRPLLVSLGHEAYGGQPDGAILRAACSIELMQTFLLIHDDIMDHADDRRGAATAHRQLSVSAPVWGVTNAEHHGVTLAILAGDIAAAYGMMAIGTSGFAPERSARAQQLYAEVVADEGYGQVLDSTAMVSSGCTAEDVANTAYYKTARYTTEGPLHLGAVLAGVGDGELDCLSAYARPLGYAFQLQDDILDLTGDPLKTNKTRGKDILEGKRTLPILMGLERAGPRGREQIEAALGKAEPPDREVVAIVDLLSSLGIFVDAAKRVESLADEAKAALSACAVPEETRERLAEFADYLVRRNS